MWSVVKYSDFGIAKDLPAYKTTSIQFTPDKAGESIFTCCMNMMQGIRTIKTFTISVGRTRNLWFHRFRFVLYGRRQI